MATHSIGSIVTRTRAKDLEKYAGYKHLKDYGIVREKHEEEEEEEERVNIEWYVDHPSKSNYFDSDEDYFPSKLYRTVVEYGAHLEVEYLGLQDHFFQRNDGEWDLDIYHDHFCPHCNLRPCVLEEQAEEIYYIFAGVRLEVTSRRRKRLKAYEEFVRMIYGTLGVGVRVELPSCCVETIRGEFPKESDGEAYNGFQLANNN